MTGIPSLVSNAASLLGLIKVPAGIVTGDGLVCEINAPAARKLAKDALLALHDNASWLAACRRAVRDGLADVEIATGAMLRLTCIETGKRHSKDYVVHYPSMRLLFAETDKAEALRSEDADPSRLASTPQLNCLTRAEIGVVIAFAGGNRPSAIAEMRGCSVWTVRQHLKNVRRKLGISNLFTLQQVLRSGSNRDDAKFSAMLPPETNPMASMMR